MPIMQPKLLEKSAGGKLKLENKSLQDENTMLKEVNTALSKKNRKAENEMFPLR